jgi:hypothetical protein
MRYITAALLLTVAVAVRFETPAATQASGAAWPVHVIDNSSRGADGVRLLDVNQDGQLDIATGWEEGGRIRAYLNPGGASARQPWRSVEVGRVNTPEDAVFVDLDADGAVDVVSSTEGDERTVFVHWAPGARTDYGTRAAWKTERLPASVDRMQWMFTTPLQVDGILGVDLVSGGKNDQAKVGWFEAPANARDLGRWMWHPIYNAGWIMSIVPVDMDADADVDLVVSDRLGPASGTLWLENPGPGDAQKRDWPSHLIGAAGREAMFLTVADLDGDGLDDVVTAVRPKEILFHRRLSRDGRRWSEHRINVPALAGTAKSVAVADIDLDGKPDLVLSAEGARGPLSGVVWLSYRNAPTDREWVARDISGAPGTKFDLVRLVDLDGDGDLDVLTCEEIENLGVIWYENPAR